MNRESLDKVVIELLPDDSNISQFSLDWILNSPRATNESAKQVYNMLKGYGLSDDKIASRAELLGMNPETIDRNYNHHVRLLRKGNSDRKSGRTLLTNQAQILGIPPETINANVQYLHSLGIDYNNAMLLGTTIQLKRKKMAWMLRELFDYRTIPEEERKNTIKKLYEFVKSNPSILVKSINALEKFKEKLKVKVKNKN